MHARKILRNIGLAGAWLASLALPTALGDQVVCEPQGAVNNPFHPPTYWYDVWAMTPR